MRCSLSGIIPTRQIGSSWRNASTSGRVSSTFSVQHRGGIATIAVTGFWVPIIDLLWRVFGIHAARFSCLHVGYFWQWKPPLFSKLFIRSPSSVVYACHKKLTCLSSHRFVLNPGGRRSEKAGLRKRTDVLCITCSLLFWVERVLTHSPWNVYRHVGFFSLASAL